MTMTLAVGASHTRVRFAHTGAKFARRSGAEQMHKKNAR